MIEKRIFDYYAFGHDCQLLFAYGPGDPLNGSDVRALRTRLQVFLAQLESLNLRVTLHAADKVRELVGKTKAKADDTKVDEQMADDVREAVHKLDVTLDAELKLTCAYVVTPKRFSNENLLKLPQNLLGANVFASLYPLAQFDFGEACRCIAFELPTAAAFHLMRCVEGAVRGYYCSIVKRGRVSRLMWHDMLEHLSKRRDAPPKALKDNLDNIRSNFRNPTQHPEAKYDLDEAQDLLAIAVDALSRIHRDLQLRK